MTRAKKLTRRANVAAVAAIPPAVFLAAMLVASGGAWSPVATGFTAGVGILATASLLCSLLAHYHRGVSLTGDSPQVTHPSVTPAEVHK